MAENNVPQVDGEEELDMTVITLEDENGVEHLLDVLDEVDYQSNHYMALVPHVETEEELAEEEIELMIMRVTHSDEGDFLDVVEDDDEWNAVGALFEEHLSEFYEFGNEE